MRVLYITDGFPYPLTSGSLRHYNLIRGLADRHAIDLLSLVGTDFRSADTEGLEPYVEHIETFGATTRSRSVRHKVSRRVMELAMTGGDDRAGRAMAATAEAVLRRGRHDVVLVGGRRTIPAVDHHGSTPLVVDLCDAGSARLSASLEYAPARRQAFIRYQIGRARSNERRLVAAADHLLFASNRDLEQILGPRASAARATVLPNGVDLDFWRRTSDLLGDEVVFSGAMHYPPNDDAARFLVERVMPRVWVREPNARVRIVGRDPSSALRATADDPRVTITGYVDDVRPHLEHAAVYAAPLRFASGIQNKLLEAMAMELPVITTQVAAVGLEVDDARAPLAITAPDEDAFAVEVVHAMARARADRRPHRAGRDFVGERFRWERAVGILERVLEEARRRGDAGAGQDRGSM